MGVNFVFIVENVGKRTQEEINQKFGVQLFADKSIIPEWEIFTFRGKEYAMWNFPPRFFIIEEDPEKWEALRKYLARVMAFFDAKEILYTNDVCWLGLPSEDVDDENAEDGYYLPGSICPEYLKEPDYEKYPELKDIKELEGLFW